MDPQLFTAEPNSRADGYSWTLASMLGDMIWRAEQLYGARDQAYTILGVEFRDGGPQVWYPGNRQHIVIQLSRSAMNNAVLAYWQLAHESIHLLAPNDGGPASVLEEGIAVTFSHRYINDRFQAVMPTGDDRFSRAAELFIEAEAFDPAFPINLRHATGRFSGISVHELLQAAPTIPRPLGEELVRGFDDREHGT